MPAQDMRILVADDEEVMRLLFSRVLESLGYSCDHAVDGKECIKKFAAGKPYDVLFLDLVMPKIDGELVLRQIVGKYPGTYVIIASVQDDEEAIRELLGEGATAYLRKPVTSEAIESVMKKLEEMRAGTRSRITHPGSGD